MTRPRLQSTRRRGVTLAEVLAAIAIMVIVLPVIMQGISIATGLASITRQRAQATSLAQSKLNELVATNQWQTAALNGDFGADAPGYQWQASATDWEEANLTQLQVSVTWTNRGTPREVILDTLIYTGAVSQ
jgi:prepilin-type N-terminal cleavage/methylation domain-containing protein